MLFRGQLFAKPVAVPPEAQGREPVRDHAADDQEREGHRLQNVHLS